MVTFACDRCHETLGRDALPEPFTATDTNGIRLSIVVSATRAGYESRPALLCRRCIITIVTGDGPRRTRRGRIGGGKREKNR